MSQNVKAARIATAYGELKKLIEGTSYNKIIKTANKIISDDAKQSEAWLVKVVALMQTDQFKEAANNITRAPNAKDMQYELAYCKYRLNDVEGAMEVLSNSPVKNTEKGRELMSQILYRLEQYEECYSSYKELLRSTDDEFDIERSSNMAAVQVYRTLQGKCKAPGAPKSSDSYEQWYNSACAALAAGDLVEGEKRLSTSITKCEEMLEEEGAEEEEIQQETAIIKVQQAYTLQQLGNEKEALKVYNSVLQYKLSDPALVAILHNNIASAGQRDGSVLEIRKRMKASQTPDLVHKLTSRHIDQMTLNNCILAYQSQQSLQEDSSLLEDCSRLISSSSSCAPVRLGALLVLSSSQAKSGKMAEAMERLHQWGSDHPEDMRVVTLAATQLRLMKSDVSNAIIELSSLPPSEQYRPGIVGALVTLLNNKKQKTAVTKLLDDAVKYHAKNKSSDLSALEHLLRRASDLQMKEGCPEAAANALEQLRISNPEMGSACLASLIDAYSQFDKSKALELSRTLPDLDTSDLDVEALEASLGPKYFMKSAAKDLPTKTDAAAVRANPRKKKKRKTVLPKSYVQGVVPDPDRWLPRWQRKAGGGKRKNWRKDRDVGKGTQGGTGDAADKYDITKNPNKYKGSSVPQPSEPQGPRRNMPKKKGKKK